MTQADLLLRWTRTRPRVRALLTATPVVLLVLLVVLFNVTGFRGVDLGYHWDETEWHIKPMRLMLSTGILLPRSYIYPSVDKWLEMLPTLGPGLRSAFFANGSPQEIQAAMVAVVDAPGYLLVARRIFIVVSSLAIVWVFGAALAVRHRWWEALVAAASLGASWEYAYHARWVVTDCILVQFSALTLFMLTLFHRTRKLLWLYAAAVAAGLGTGTKYTGVFLLVPVLLASALLLPFKRFFSQALRAALLCGVAFAVYLITTPGTVLDPFTFLSETRFISTYYAHTHGGYTATSAFHHAWIVLNYLSLAYFSPYPALALVLFLVVVVGGILWMRRDRRLGAVIVLFPLGFLLFFCVKYRVVMVRNYLFVVPFLSLLLARAIADLNRRLAPGWARRALAGTLVAVLALHSVWLIRAGESIRHVDPEAYARRALAYVSEHAQSQFRVSPQVRALAKKQHLALPSNVTKRDAAHVVFFARAEGPDPWSWKVNDPFLTEAVFGPLEINFNWYSSWSGNDRVVVMRMDKAKSTGVVLAQ